jgi:hypothetical protein
MRVSRADQRLRLGRRHGGGDARLMVLDAALELLEQLLALGGEHQGVGAAVGGRGAPLDQAALLQLVDHRHHGRAVELGGGGEQALRHARVGGNQHQHAEAARRDVEFLQLGGEIAEHGQLGQAQLVADQAGQQVELEILGGRLGFCAHVGSHNGLKAKRILTG